MSFWYLLYCKTQDVEKITRRISTAGVRTFCPRYTRISPRTDCNAVRVEEKILFPNYIFVSFDINQIHTSEIASIPGVVGFVRFGTDICTVSQKIITALECASFISLNNDDDAIECRNISEALLDKIREISFIRSIPQRQIAFTRLLQSPEF